MKCLKCQTSNAIKHPFLGWLYCDDCQKGKRLELPAEFVPSSVKESRVEHKDDIIQSFRGDTLSKERLDKYGTQGLKVTPEQIKNAKYVWSGEGVEGRPYKEGNPKII